MRIAASTLRAPALVALAALVASAFAAPSVAIAAEKPKSTPAKSEWVFDILPKSLQKNPRLEITVITEMTAAGRARPAVSPQAPAYFETFSNGARHQGDVAGNDVTLKPEDAERALVRALAANGYRPASRPEHPPSLLIVYMWGSHATLNEGDAENPALSAEQIARNLLDRAALVGGEKFASRLVDLFQQADALSLAASAPVPPGGASVLGPAAEFMNPVAQFKRSDPRHEFLLDQAASNVYYVVASAYDYASVVAKKRTLLWRTRMTVAADGVSQTQTLPTLIATAAPYFGRDMPETEIIHRPTLRETNVEVGTPTVVEPPPPKK